MSFPLAGKEGEEGPSPPKRKPVPTEAHKHRMALIKKTLKKI